MPSGPRVAAISRSLRTLLNRWPARAPTTWWTGGATWDTHEDDAEHRRAARSGRRRPRGGRPAGRSRSPGRPAPASGRPAAATRRRRDPGTDRVRVVKNRAAGRVARARTARSETGERPHRHPRRARGHRRPALAAVRPAAGPGRRAPGSRSVGLLPLAEPGDGLLDPGRAGLGLLRLLDPAHPLLAVGVGQPVVRRSRGVVHRRREVGGQRPPRGVRCRGRCRPRSSSPAATPAASRCSALSGTRNRPPIRTAVVR